MCDAGLISPDPTTKKRETRPDLEKLPAFVPLLRPASACGFEFDEVRRLGSGDWWAAQQAHNIMWNLKTGLSKDGNKDSVKVTSPCIDAPYKAKLLDVIKDIVKRRKSLTLARALGITDI